MKLKWHSVIAACLAVMLLLMAGCGKKDKGVVSSSGGEGSYSSGGGAGFGGNGNGTGENGGEAGNNENGSGGNVGGTGNGADGGSGPAGNTGTGSGSGGAGTNGGGNAGSVESEAWSDTVFADYAKTEYTFRDYILDRKNLDGKLAVFYFRSDYSGFPGGFDPGDNEFILAPDGTTIMIDVNGSGCNSYMIDSIKKLGIKKIDHLFISHTHEDHMGGYREVLNSFEIGTLYTSASLFYTQGKGMYHELLDMAKKKGIHCEVISSKTSKDTGKSETPYSFNCGPVNVQIFYPWEDMDWEASFKDASLNNESVCMKLTYKNSTFWFGGDIGDNGTEQREMMAKYGDLIKCDIVKMNHHSIQDNNQPDWIEFMHATAAIGVGGKPNGLSAMTNWTGDGVLAFHTGLDGTVLVTTDGSRTYDIQVEKHRSNALYAGLLEEKADGHYKIKAR